MKFVCDGCGKKYATAEDPSPGKIYKLKCKACGHLIVVKAMAGTSTAIPALTSAELASGSAGSPELEIEIEPDGRSAAPAEPEPMDDDAVIQDPAPLPPEVTGAIDAVAPIPAPAPKADVLPPPPPPGKDELADFTAAAREAMATPVPGVQPGYVDLFGDGITGERPAKADPAKDDPFAAAARASLPAGSTAAPREPRADARKPAQAKAEAPRLPAARAQGQKGPSPLVFVGLGAVLIGVITAVAIFTGGKKPEPTPPAPVAVAPKPTPVPAAPPPRAEPAPEPPPPVVEKKPEPKPVVERKPEPKPEPRVEAKAEPPRPRPVERPAVVERKPEPRPEPPKVAVAPPPEERVETRDVQLPDAEAALAPEVVQKVITSNRKAFASCIAQAASDVKLDGRKVALKLTVNANGAVTYPTLDDVTLNPTEMGQCLKSAARLMIFPKFRGDPFHVEVPLTLSN